MPLPMRSRNIVGANIMGYKKHLSHIAVGVALTIWITEITVTEITVTGA